MYEELCIAGPEAHPRGKISQEYTWKQIRSDPEFRSRILQIDIVPYGSAKGDILGVGIPGEQRVFRRHASFIIRPSFFSLGTVGCGLVGALSNESDVGSTLYLE